MIITITGKPCSGKGSTSKCICEQFNFEYIGAGDMFRADAKAQGYESILEFNKDTERVLITENKVDTKLAEIGKTRTDENLLVEARLGWYFIPNSFKVFLDIDLDTAAYRLIKAARETEQAIDTEHAKEQLVERWNVENARYQMHYGIDNLNMNNYDFVLNTIGQTAEQTAKEVMDAYKKFMRKA